MKIISLEAYYDAHIGSEIGKRVLLNHRISCANLVDLHRIYNLHQLAVRMWLFKGQLYAAVSCLC